MSVKDRVIAIIAEQAVLEPSDVTMESTLEDLGIDSLGLVKNAGETGAYLNSAMKDALGRHVHVGDVRGEGMLCAVEFVEDREKRTFFDPAKKVGPAVAAALLKKGIIARAMPQGDILGFAPPFCLTEAQADEIATKLGRAVRSVLG